MSLLKVSLEIESENERAKRRKITFISSDVTF